MLTTFHGKPPEDPYRHVDELSQVCEINHLQNVPSDTMQMKLFLATDVCFRVSLNHKDDSQIKFIKPYSQRQDIIIKYWVSIGSIHIEQG